MIYLFIGVVCFLCGYYFRSLLPQQTTVHVRVPTDDGGAIVKVVRADIERGGELRQLIQDVLAK